LFSGSPKVARLGFEADDDPGELAEVEPADTDLEEE
jgi:hypothetical protein